MSNIFLISIHVYDMRAESSYTAAVMEAFAFAFLEAGIWNVRTSKSGGSLHQDCLKSDGFLVWSPTRLCASAYERTKHSALYKLAETNLFLKGGKARSE
jgi:hypothetical protein